MVGSDGDVIMEKNDENELDTARKRNATVLQEIEERRNIILTSIKKESSIGPLLGHNGFIIYILEEKVMRKQPLRGIPRL